MQALHRGGDQSLAPFFRMLLRRGQQYGQLLLQEHFPGGKAGMRIVPHCGSEPVHRPGGGAVAEILADQDADRGRRQETVGMRALVLDAFEQKEGLKQMFLFPQARHETNSAIALLMAEEQIHGTGDHGMVPGQEFDLFMAEGGAAVEGDDQLLALERRQRELRLGEEGEVELKGAPADLFGEDAVEVKYFQQVFFEFLAFVVGGDAALQVMCCLGVAGVEGQQPVLAFLHGHGDLRLQGARALDEGLQPADPGGGGALGQLGAQGGVDFPGSRQVGGKSIQPFMIPAGDDLLAAPLEIGDENLNGLLLADAVEAADALLEQLGIGRQVEEEELVAELEITPLAADLRTDQHPRSLCLSKPGGIAVALQQGEVLMKQGDADIDQALQSRGDGSGLFGTVTDQQHLAAAMLAQVLCEPGQPRIVVIRPGWTRPDMRPFAMLRCGGRGGRRGIRHLFSERFRQRRTRLG